MGKTKEFMGIFQPIGNKHLIFPAKREKEEI
jgi:hypothetical protein